MSGVHRAGSTLREVLRHSGMGRQQGRPWCLLNKPPRSWFSRSAGPKHSNWQD